MKKVLYTLGALALPLVTFAQATFSEAQGIGKIGALLKSFLAYVSPILVSIAVVYFLYGVLRYVVTADSEAKDKAKDTMIYGLIGIAVMVSVYGLVRLITSTFSLDNQTIQAPVIDIKPGNN